MFGHGAFDISRSFRNEGNESLPDTNDVYENWRRCYGVNPPCTDAERDSWDEKNDKVGEIQKMLFDLGGTIDSPQPTEDGGFSTDFTGEWE